MNDRLPSIAGTRIPYHPVVQERYGVAAEQWRALVDSVFPSAKTIEGVILALSYCKARNLDVFKRPVHIVPIWNSALGREIETVWPGIGELRTTAFRTGQYAGAEPAAFGPDITRTFRGQVGRGDRQRNAEETVTFPEWAQFTVYRQDRQGAAHSWPGPRVYWLETYQKQGRSEVPNEMWTRRARGQLEKCAEAAALRRAFPEEIGEEYIGDEAPTMRDITPAQPEAAMPAPEDPMDRVVSEARGNGASGPVEAATAHPSIPEVSEPPAAASAPDTPKAPPLPPLPRGEDLERPRRGRPTNAERNARIAREITEAVLGAKPDDVGEVLRAHQAELQGLPDDVRAEVLSAAQDRAADAVDPGPEAYDLETGEISEAGGPEPEPEPEPRPEPDPFDAWAAAMHRDMANQPREFLVASKARWTQDGRTRFGERAVEAVAEAFGAR